MTLLPPWMLSFCKVKYPINQYCIVHESVLWFNTLILYWYLKRKPFLAEVFFLSWPFCQPYAHSEKAFFCHDFFFLLFCSQIPKEWTLIFSPDLFLQDTSKWYDRYLQAAECSKLSQKCYILKFCSLLHSSQCMWCVTEHHFWLNKYSFIYFLLSALCCCYLHVHNY